jgi:hypothetical protein
MVAGRTTRNPSTLGVSLVIQRWGEVIFDELWRLEWRLARTERAHRRPMNVPMEEMESVREKAMREVNTLKDLIESTKSSASSIARIALVYQPLISIWITNRKTKHGKADT